MHPDASEWMWTDAHNELQEIQLASIVFNKHKKETDHIVVGFLF